MNRNKLTTVVATLVFTIALSLVSGCATQQTSEQTDNAREAPSNGEMFADAAAVRPMTFTYALVGALAWVATLPFTIPSGETGHMGQALVVDPLRYTFTRPLGRMEKDDVIEYQGQ